MCPYVAFCKMSSVIWLKLSYNMFTAVKRQFLGLSWWKKVQITISQILYLVWSSSLCPYMAFVKKHYMTSFINCDPIYKLDLYTKFCWKTHKNHIFAKKHKLHGLISWIKVYKLHKKKNFDKCHIWISFIKFDPTSKFRKTRFLFFYVFYNLKSQLKYISKLDQRQ